MALTFEEVLDDASLEKLGLVAEEIWTEYWPALIGREQTDYMVGMFHSVPAMKNDIEQHGYRFWFVYDESETCVGYTAGAPEIMTGDAERDASIMHNPVVQRRWSRRWFISKIYLYENERGKHYSSEIIRFHEALCREQDLQVMYLTVNVNNRLGIRSYLGNGFEIVDSRPSDIGSGFVMDDHIMAKEIV